MLSARKCDPSEQSERNVALSTDGTSAIERVQAFEDFRKSYRHSAEIDDKKKLLKIKYKDAKALGEKVNEARNKISESLLILSAKANHIYCLLLIPVKFSCTDVIGAIAVTKWKTAERFYFEVLINLYFNSTDNKFLEIRQAETTGAEVQDMQGCSGD